MTQNSIIGAPLPPPLPINNLQFLLSQVEKLYVAAPFYPQMLTKLISCHKTAKQLVRFPVA